jgi:hypothetical protein
MLPSSGRDGGRRTPLSRRWSCSSLFGIVVVGSLKIVGVLVVIRFAASNQHGFQRKVNSLPSCIRGKEDMRSTIRHRSER